MEVYRLTFAKMIKHDAFLAEVVVDEGVLITMNMVNEFHKWITDNLNSPCYLLINKLNSYHFTLTSEKKIGSLEQIKSIAVVSYDEKTRQHTEKLRSKNEGHWKLRHFENVSDAMSWLY